MYLHGSTKGQKLPKKTTPKEHPIHQMIQMNVGEKFINASCDPQAAAEKHNKSKKAEKAPIKCFMTLEFMQGSVSKFCISIEYEKRCKNLLFGNIAIIRNVSATIRHEQAITQPIGTGKSYRSPNP